ncbi:zinc finger protein 282-like [Pleurodeles waltl]|uniref:zinc finger protein 282-like n=1 Tax=Pleurodeles waltl TaxID=8319 RepID=UPI0037093D86
MRSVSLAGSLLPRLRTEAVRCLPLSAHAHWSSEPWLGVKFGEKPLCSLLPPRPQAEAEEAAERGAPGPREMSWKGTEEALFHDAAAFFSEEEWQLLQEWQKALYRNVMKEIHQALLSLGPLIASTVCTLRAKDKYEMEEEPPERRPQMNHWPMDTEAKANDLFIVNKEETLLNNSPVQRRRERNDCARAEFSSLDPGALMKKEEESGAIFIDHLGAEIGESSSDPSSAYEVVSVCIKDESETYCIDASDSKRKESVSSPTAGNESTERKRKSGGHLKGSGKSTLCTSLPEQINTMALQGSDEEATSRRPLCSDFQQPREEGPSQCRSSFSNPVHLASQQGRLEAGGSEHYSAFQNNHRKPQFLNVLQSTPHYQKRDSSTDSGKNSSLREKFTRPFRTNSRERPYTCTECGKSFFQKSCLVTHHRIHSSEKPYMCTFCPKRFNRKDYLDGHIRIHTGERPYKCVKCDKSFVWKSHLNNHQKKHT